MQVNPEELTWGQVEPWNGGRGKKVEKQKDRQKNQIYFLNKIKPSWKYNDISFIRRRMENCKLLSAESNKLIFFLSTIFSIKTFKNSNFMIEVYTLKI